MHDADLCTGRRTSQPEVCREIADDPEDDPCDQGLREQRVAVMAEPYDDVPEERPSPERPAVTRRVTRWKRPTLPFVVAVRSYRPIFLSSTIRQ